MTSDAGPVDVGLDEHEARIAQDGYTVLERAIDADFADALAAELLDLPPSTLAFRMKKLGIERPKK